MKSTSIDTIPQSANNTLKQYHVLYLLALSVIAVITLISQVLIQKHLDNQIHDSHLINYAARLRTNSQALAKLSLKLLNGENLKTTSKDFETTLLQWKNTHESLLLGNEFLSLPKNKNLDMFELYKIIDRPYRSILNAGSAVVELMEEGDIKNLSIIKPYINTILENEYSYFLGMEMIVFDYDRISRTNIADLKKIEYTLLGIVFLMLMLEAFFIFIPLANKIKISFSGLIESEEKAKELAKALKENNKILEQSHNELREVNFALEKASYLVKIDADGNIIYANDKYCHVTKYNMNTLIGKPIFYNNMGGDESIIYKHIKSNEVRKEVWQGEIFDHASDGTGFWLDVTVMPVINKKGEVDQFLVIGFDITLRKKTEEELRLLSEEKLRRQKIIQKVRNKATLIGQEKERKRVAAEIHDGIGQMLTSLRIQVEFLEEKNPKNVKEISLLYQLIHSIVNETRRICFELQPNILEDFGLKSALSDLIKNIRKNTGYNIVYEDHYDIQEKLPERDIAIYRIVQETLNNAVKHSKAEKITVFIESDAEFITLQIRDNGVGFSYDSNHIFEVKNNTHGIRNIKERVELLNAKLLINSELEKGTVIKVEIPIDRSLDLEEI
ncbi:hypothetical protein FHR24_002427 [Wenyingzhuangia heitensis]|uniref:histidine kinase n=1 Tax=Wenyingzhuangia heitensis TaxID=1487859 RepID=A0ABX0UET8_9FLAO|nr:histidine kinase [Wenyingzhuangia heitensis]NIJ45956.1 hypothetical protein [Wenyingzhuangia heitensis]